ncbi:hypothetical protein NX059_002317 [Plenodomus lindquistii]|nr:hypothetical protein NX059_002317 [Plenodomus lindquistii]
MISKIPIFRENKNSSFLGFAQIAKYECSVSHMLSFSLDSTQVTVAEKMELSMMASPRFKLSPHRHTGDSLSILLIAYQASPGSMHKKRYAYRERNSRSNRRMMIQFVPVCTQSAVEPRA